jgi:predicted phage terminase large subunit-like protein
MTENMRVFKEQWLLANTYDELPEILEIFGSCDPSLGKSKNSDTSAIIILGRGVDNYIYILEADICRRKPDKIIEDMILHIAKYYEKLKGFVVETNVMQQFFANTVKEKFFDAGLYINWIEVKQQPGDAKSRRIKSMIPKIKLGFIKFNKSHTRLWNQLKNFPKTKDDGPDALQMALSQIMAANISSFSFGSIDTKRSKKRAFDAGRYFG